MGLLFNHFVISVTLFIGGFLLYKLLSFLAELPEKRKIIIRLHESIKEKEDRHKQKKKIQLFYFVTLVWLIIFINIMIFIQ